jgi:hypothetical protein
VNRLSGVGTRTLIGMVLWINLLDLFPVPASPPLNKAHRLDAMRY